MIKIYLYRSRFPYNGEKINDGLSKAVHGLASGIVNCGVQVVILCESSPTHDSVYKTEAGYEIRCFANPIQTRPSFKISSSLKQYICNHLDGNSLVILNGIFYPNVYSLSQVLKKQNISYIIAPHDPYNPAIFQKKGYLKWLYWYILERRMLQQAAAVQVLDAQHGNWLRHLGIRSPILAIPNGFSPKDVYPETSLEWSQSKTVKLFFLGRIDAYNKGLDLLLDVVEQVKGIIDVHLTIQGPDWGDKKSLQEKVAKLSISDRVSFLEPDFNVSPSQLIQNYDIFCIPSRFEGFSLAALEAMLAGRVLLVSNIAGIATHAQISDCGIVVSPEVSAIKAGLIELVKNRLNWQTMGLNGRRYALENLTWNQIGFTALQQYQHLLKDKFSKQ
jgi:glycosyltransferase involved in cell wall biosynthesis